MGRRRADNLWSDKANWQRRRRTAAGRQPRLPAGRPTENNVVNDFAAGTRFRSITISDSGYQVSEKNAGQDGVTLLDGFVYNATASGATFSPSITLGASQTFYSANQGASITLGPSQGTGGINVANLQLDRRRRSAPWTFEGQLSGSGNITKQGDGTLVLGHDNTPYTGIITINQGIITGANDMALGSTSAPIFVGDWITQGSSWTVGLQLQGGITVPKNIDFYGNGEGFNETTLGAIRSLAANGNGTSDPANRNVLTGVITLEGNDGTIGVDQGSYLTVSGQIMDAQQVSDQPLTKFGAGTLELAGSQDNAISGNFMVAQGTVVLNKTGGAVPFYANLYIGDNRDGETAAEAATVIEDQPDQIPALNWARTATTSVLVFADGTLNLNGFNNQIGTLVMYQGRSQSAQVMTGTGTLSLLGDIGVNVQQANFGNAQAFEGTSGASPPAQIAGNLDLGSSFDGIGGNQTLGANGGDTTGRTIAVAGPAEPTTFPSLWIRPTSAGNRYEPLRKTMGGGLLLSGANTYSGPTMLDAGFCDIAGNSAFGNSSLVSIGGIVGFRSAAIAGTPTVLTPSNIIETFTAAVSSTVSNPISLDGSLIVYGGGAIDFTGPVTETASRTVETLDPTQVTTFGAGISEGLWFGQSFTKLGRGELDIDGPASFTGALAVGKSNAEDGGTLRFAGQYGALETNVAGITVNQGSSLILDNSGSTNGVPNVNNTRLPQADAITLNGGALRLIGNATANVSETVGVVAPQNLFTSTIESDTTGSGTPS